jgi:penicillin amidase
MLAAMPRPMFLLLLAAAVQAAPPPQARGVTILRDTWGAPHVEAPTDAGAVFGLMYAQAEDNFWQLEEDTLRSLGRAAELNGGRALSGDLRLRAFETVRLARAEYARLAGWARALCDAYAAGVNWFLEKNPQVRPRLLHRWEPWYILAIQNAGNAGAADARGAQLKPDEVAAAFPGARLRPEPAGPDAPPADEGSNMWALSPARTTSGHALLLINPHVGFFGGGQRYEAHLRSRQGLEVSGFAILGTPYIRSGFTSHHAWSHTNNYADVSDFWWESLASAEAWTEDVKVGQEVRRVTFRKTRHGPVLGVRNGQGCAVRAPLLEKGGILEQRVLMAKARSLAGFEQALRRLSLTGSNTLYADRRGNIFYLHGNAIPKRRPDGEWDGYHAYEDLPRLLNPPSGYIQNCNSTPFLGAGPETPLDRSKFPAYMAPEPDTLRAQRAREILESADRFSYEDMLRLAPDTKVLAWSRDGATLLKAAPPEVVAVLKGWDGVARLESVAATLFIRWRQQSDALKEPAAALARVRAALEKDWGAWKVAWGDVNRLQRIHTSGVQEEFSDARPSAAVQGCPGVFGCLFTYNTRTPAGAKRGYGTSGNTYVALVELGRRVTARSIVTFGQNANPASPHFFDQGPLYAVGKFKDAPFDRGAVKRAARSVTRLDRR